MNSDRLEFKDFKLIKRTFYQTTFREKTVDIWRHVFIKGDTKLIYSGKALPLNLFDNVSLKATIKRQEEFGLRISRPKIIKNNC